MPSPKELLDDSQTYSELGFPTGDKDNPRNAVLRDAALGVVAAVPDLINSFADTGKGIYDFTQGNPYEEIEIFDLSAIEEITEGSLAYEIPKALTQFAIPFAGWGKAATTVGITSKAIKGVKAKAAFETGKAAIVGGLADVTAFKAYEDNFFNLFDPLIDKYPSLNNPIHDYLRATTPEEAGFAEAKIRQFVSGIVPGEIIGLTGKAAFKGGQVLKGLIGRLDDVKANKEISKLILGRWAKDNGLNVDGILPTSIEDIDVSKIKKVYAASDDIDNLGDEIIPDQTKEVSEITGSKQTPKLDLTTDTRGKGDFYHGAADEFELDSSSHYKAPGLYGQGLYTTDDVTTAGKYQKKNRKLVKTDAKQTVYKITEKQPVNFFDLDQPVPQDIVETLEGLQAQSELYDEVIGRTFDEFKIGSYNKSTGKNPSLGQIFDELKAQNSANEFMPAYEIDNIISDVESKLRDQGFGGFTHQGGKKAGRGKRLHQVKIYWDPKDQLNINKVDTGGGGAVPPRKPPSGSGTDVPPSGKKKQDLGDPNILPNQVNPEQIGNTPSQVRFLEKVLRGMKLEEDASGFYRVKTNEDTVDEVIQLLQDSSALKEKAKFMAQIYKLIPSDSLNRALAEYVTLTNQRIANTNGSLIEALGTLDNPQQIEDLSEQLIKNFDDLDEWLRLGMPLRSEAGLALGSLAAPTKGIEPEEWLKLSPNERYRANKAQSGDVNIATGHSSVKLKNLQENIRKAVAEGKESGDFSKLNKLANTVKRANGNPEKLEKLFGMELLDRILNPNTYLRPLNEVLINAVLFSPTTQEINFVSNALEAYMAPLELALDPKNIIDPGQLRMAKEHFIAMHSDFNFALKAFKESWQTQENVLAPGRIKSDFEDRFVISMDDEGLTYGDNFRQKLLADSINFFGDYIVRPSGRFMGSMDALFQAGAMRGSSVSRAWLGGWEKGLRGQELADYTKKHSGAVWESIVKRSGKGITDDESAEIYESVREFAKRSTYTEDIRTDGSVVGPIAKGIQSLASIPLVRRFQLFTRSPVNIIKRGFRRTPVLNMMMKEFRYDLLESPDPFVRKQTRGQLALSVLATSGFVGLIHGQNYMKVETQDVVKRRTKAGNPPNIVLTGGGPDTSTSAGRELYWSQWKDGWRPYSYAKLQRNEDGTPQIDANGNYQYIHHSYKRLDPLSSWIGFLVDMHQVEEHMTDGDYQEMMGAFMVAFGRNFTDRTFMQGIGDAANFWLNPGRAEKWLARQAASNVPQSNLWRYMKRLPGDLLEMKGLPPEEIERWQVKPDMTVRPGDKEFGGLASSLNNFSATVPGYGKGLPPQREHITNKFITYPKRYGPDVLNWVESSPTRNIPILAELRKLGQILPEPPDTISHSNPVMRKNSAPYPLNGTQYDELKYLVNTIPNPKTGFTLEEALMNYTKTQNYKENMAIIESQDNPLEVPDAVKRIMDAPNGLNSINQMYIQQGIDKWIELTGREAYNKQVQIKRDNDAKYSELLNKARQEAEFNFSPN